MPASPNLELFNMRRVSKTLTVIVLAGIVAAVAWRLIREDAIGVEVYTVSRGEVLSTVANTRAGTVKACQRARLSPNASGQVTKLNVTEGSVVKTGDLLMELWHRDLDAQLELRQQQAKSAEQRAAATCIQAETAKRDAQRGRDLKERGFIADEELDRRNAAADAGVRACRAERLTAAAAGAQIAVIKTAIDRTILKAPFDGVVAEVNAEIGEFMTPSPTGIATLPAVDLINDDCLFVSAPIDEVDAPQVRLDQEVIVTLDAFRGEQFAGRVRRIAPYVLDLEKQARTVEVETQLVGPDQAGQLLIGYSADIEVVLERRKSVLRVPTSALLDDTHVYRITSDDVLEKVQFAPGLSSWSFVEVTDGLQANDRIVDNPPRKLLEPGKRVTDKADQADNES